MSQVFVLLSKEREAGGSGLYEKENTAMGKRKPAPKPEDDATPPTTTRRRRTCERRHADHRSAIIRHKRCSVLQYRLQKPLPLPS